MVDAARAGLVVLGPAAASAIRGFLLGQQEEGGAFRNRAGRGDLYYTTFALQALAAFGNPGSKPRLPQPLTGRVIEYLHSFANGDGLDFVHLCCLARAWFLLSTLNSQCQCPAGARSEILRKVEVHRSSDGGYNLQPGSGAGTAYGAFLAFGAYEDLGENMPDSSALAGSLRDLETGSGAWTNRVLESPEAHILKSESTNATCAALAVLSSLAAPAPRATAAWLLARAHPAGGFTAGTATRAPDLLSTATALHALAGLGISIAGLRERCLDFLDGLWSAKGGFYGYWGDDDLDCEYAFYGMLAAGHLRYE
jgi:prenyltransferase beta subunit